MARHWHFLSVLFWVGNGLVFVVLLFGPGSGGAWCRHPGTIVPDAWAVFVHYATFHLPPEPNGFYTTTPFSDSPTSVSCSFWLPWRC